VLVFFWRETTARSPNQLLGPYGSASLALL
jgi:hypothetical protein